MILYHAGKEKVEFPEVRKMKYTKDFSWGFYCTNNYEQAVRWVGRGEGEPIINYYDYTVCSAHFRLTGSEAQCYHKHSVPEPGCSFEK